MNILTREVPARNLKMFGNLIIGAFVVGVMASPHFAPRRGCYGESKVDIVKLTVQKFANEAYPQWHRAYGADCPRSLYELIEYMDRDDTRDAWGQPYRLACSNESSWRSPIRVWSIGEDGIPNTFDDLRSWD